MIKIILVDGGADFRCSASRSLIELADDFFIVAVDSAGSALDKLKTERFDCILCSYELPDTDGLELLRLVRSQGKGIPFILLADSEDEQLMVKARREGVDGIRVRPRSETEFSGLADEIHHLTEDSETSAIENADVSYRDEHEMAIRSIFEHSTVGFYRTTPTGRIVMGNPALVRMLGYSSFEEMARLNLEGNGWTADYARNNFKEKLDKEGQIIGLETKWLRKDGKPIYLRENATALRDEGGNLLFLQGTLEDITEKKKAEDALRAQTFFLQQLIDSIPIPIFYKDSNKIYRSCNKAFEEMLGLSKEEIIGKTVDETTKDQSRADRFESMDNKLLRNGGIQVYEDQVKYPDGSLRDAVFHKAAFLDVGGDVAGIAGAILDITERKQAEEELKHSIEKLESQAGLLDITNKELEAFAYTVSHDLQAPLRRISGWIELLLKDFSAHLPEEAVTFLERIHQNSHEIRSLVDAVLNFSRVIGAEISMVEVDISALAKRLANEMRGDQPQRNVDFRIEDGLKCEGDPLLIHLLLRNLLGNAWKYTCEEETAEIEFFSKKQDGQTIFYVKDNGMGFDPEKTGKLFVPFQRLHKNTGIEGSGIGLATVQRIVHRHGGRVWAEGEPGVGATFYFTLK